MWGDSKRDLIIAENAVAKRELELLREQVVDLKFEREELRKQLKLTQDALIAKESPEAYMDMRDAKAAENKAALTPEELNERLKKKRDAEVTLALIQEMENPLFVDADDMKAMLTRASKIPGIDTNSLHGNDES